MAEMNWENNILSTANPKANKPSNYSTMPPPTTTFIHPSKRTNNSNSAPNPSSKYQKQDDDEAVSLLSHRDIGVDYQSLTCVFLLQAYW